MRNVVLILVIAALAFSGSCVKKIPSDPAEKVLLFSAAGDVVRHESAQLDTTDPFASISPFFNSRDLVLVNLEGALDVECQPLARPDPITMPIEFLGRISQAGINAFNLANDHSLDCGPAALDTQLQWMAEADLYPLGAGIGQNLAQAPVYIANNGAGLGILSFTSKAPEISEPCRDCAEVSVFSRDSLVRYLPEMKERAKHQIVLLHWGDEHATEPTPELHAIAQEALDFGAEFFIGSGPRSPMSVKRVRGKWILYSLGSLIAGGADGTSQGLVFSVEFSNGQVTNPRLLPVQYKDGQVDFLRGPDAEPLFKRIIEQADADTRSHLSLVNDILYLR